LLSILDPETAARHVDSGPVAEPGPVGSGRFWKQKQSNGSFACGFDGAGALSMRIANTA